MTQNHAAVNDLNQCYPGTGEWIVEQIAHKIASEIVPKCTAVLDFHEGNLFSLYTVAYAIDYPDQSLGERCHELAMAFAPPCIQRGRVLVAPPKGETVKAEYPGAKSLRGYSGITYSIPAITVEIGGAGVNSALEPDWIKENLRGIKNVMKHLKILKGDMEKPEKILFSRTRTHRLNPRNVGFLVRRRPHR